MDSSVRPARTEPLLERRISEVRLRVVLRSALLWYAASASGLGALCVLLWGLGASLSIGVGEIAAVIMAAPLLVSAVRVALMRLPNTVVVRLIDQEASLQDRTATSYRIHDYAGPFARLLKLDTDNALSSVQPKTLISLRRSAALAASSATFALVLCAVWNFSTPPMIPIKFARSSPVAVRLPGARSVAANGTSAAMQRGQGLQPLASPSAQPSTPTTGSSPINPGAINSPISVPPASSQVPHAQSASSTKGAAGYDHSTLPAVAKATSSTTTASNQRSNAQSASNRPGAQARTSNRYAKNGDGSAARPAAATDQPRTPTNREQGSGESNNPTSGGRQGGGAGSKGQARAANGGSGQRSGTGQGGSRVEQANGSGPGSGRSGSDARVGSGPISGTGSHSGYYGTGPAPTVTPRRLAPVASSSTFGFRLRKASGGIAHNAADAAVAPHRLGAIGPDAHDSAPSMSSGGGQDAVEHDPDIPAGYRELVARYFGGAGGSSR
jgi:hypothetical protein